MATAEVGIDPARAVDLSNAPVTTLPGATAFLVSSPTPRAMMANTRASTPSRLPCARTRALASPVALAIAVAVGWTAPVEARAFGPAKDELPTVTDEPTPPPEDGDQVRDEPNLERAMAAFQRGSENYNMAKYDVALRDFLEAASLYASPDFQYNIGLCYEKLDKPEEAIAAFETYLKTKPDASDRANVEDRVARLREMAETRKNGGGDAPPDTKPAKSKAARQAMRPPGHSARPSP